VPDCPSILETLYNGACENALDTDCLNNCSAVLNFTDIVEVNLIGLN